MSRTIQEPTVTQEPWAGEDSVETTRHPAFGQIGASRVSGSSNLYASDFRHNAYMTITIRRSELKRSLSNDWHFGRGELIAIAMTEAQWATFVSSPNVGSGVPCTLEHVAGEVVPGLPSAPQRTEQFGKEVRAKSAEAIKALDDALVAVDDLGLSKAKADSIRGRLQTAKAQLTSSIPFVAEQFDEHMEGTVERAKAEVHGYMTGVLMRAGVTAIGAEMPLAIEHNPEQSK